jgi:hypothetical protein
MNVQTSPNVSPIIDYNSQLAEIESKLDTLSKIEKDEVLVYDAKDDKLYPLGGERVRSLRHWTGGANLAWLVQKATGFMFWTTPNLMPYTSHIKQSIEETLDGILAAARKTESEEKIKQIKEKVDHLRDKLNSEKIKNAFNSIIYSDAKTQTDLQAIKDKVENTEKGLEHEISIAALFVKDSNYQKSRIDVLVDIAKNGGSVQSYDVLTYQQYKFLLDLIQKAARKEPLSVLEETLVKRLTTPLISEASAIDSYQNAISKLQRRVNEFAHQHPLVTDPAIRDKAIQDLKELREVNEGLLQLERDKKENKIEEGEYLKQFEALTKRKRELEPTLAMIVDAKKLMRGVLSEEGEGSFIDVFSFIKSQDPNFANLAHIEALSALQSAELDDRINQEILNEHLDHRGADVPLDVVVEGAGPNGLYSAIQLFLAGANVTIVNDRGERYIRNQIVDLDPKWAMQLRYFLGTKFDELFIGENALGYYSEDGNYLSINTKNLEDALKERMAELSSYVNAQSSQRKLSSHLDIYYQAVFTQALPPSATDSKGFVAQLKSPNKPGPDDATYKLSLLDQKAIEIFNRDHPQEDPSKLLMDIETEKGTDKIPLFHEAREKAIAELMEKRIPEIEKIVRKSMKIGEEEKINLDQPLIDFVNRDGSTTRISIREQARREIEGEALELKEERLPDVQVKCDLLVCCGGVRDTVRDQYLGVPKEETVAKGYGVAVWEKGDRFRDYHFLPKGKKGRVYEPMGNFEPFLAEQGLDSLIKDSKSVPAALKEKYANLTEQIVEGLVEDKQATELAHGVPQYKKDEKGHFIINRETPRDKKQIQLRMFENKLTFYAGAETPPALLEFYKDLEKAVKEKALTQEEFGRIKAEMDRKWFAAIATRFIKETHPELIDELGSVINFDRKRDGKRLNFDPNPINTSTFPVIQYAVDKAATMLKAENGSTLMVTVLGDARASPHFYTGSGLSTGRLGIENAAIVIREFHQGTRSLENQEKLVRKLDQKLDHVKAHVLLKGSPYVKRSPEEERNKKAQASMCSLIDGQCKTKTTGFQVLKDQDRVSPDKPQFKLKVGDQSPVEARVTKEGKIECNQKVFDSLMEAVNHLREAKGI